MESGNIRRVIDPPTQQVAQNIHWWWVPLLSALLAGVCASIGGILGVAWELRKLTRQRAFDYRLEWYLRAARAMNRMGEENRILRSLVREKKDAEVLTQTRDRFVESYRKFQGEMREGLIFGTGDAITSLSILEFAIDGVLKQDPVAFCSEATCQEIDTIISQVYVDLAMDAQRHLRLKLRFHIPFFKRFSRKPITRHYGSAAANKP
jgi:hypothetical protein